LDWKLHWIVIPPYRKNGKKMEQMMKRLIAAAEKVGSLASQIDASQAKTDANQEEMKTEIRTNQERLEPTCNVSTCYLSLLKITGLTVFRKWRVGFLVSCAHLHNLAFRCCAPEEKFPVYTLNGDVGEVAAR
jgi:hypothetical protein